MEEVKDLHLNKCNVNVEDSVKDWYVFKARSLGMTRTQLMSFVIANWCETQRNAAAVQTLAELSKNSDNQRMSETFAEFAALCVAEAKKEQEQEQEQADKGSALTII